MAVPASGYTYRFRAGSNGLNYYGSSSLSNGTKINTMALDGTFEQNWRYDGSRLYVEYGPTTYCLHKNASNNAVIWAKDTSASGNNSQLIDFVGVSGTSYNCYIKLRNSSHYLQEGSGQCTWVTSQASATSWEFERLDRVVDMPSGLYTNRTEFFHRGAGQTNGESWTNVSNTQKAIAVQSFYKYVFNTAAHPADSSCLYNLYGALMYNVGSVSGKFHVGVDMTYSTGRAIRAPFSGQIIASGGSYGMVALYNSTQNKTFVFLHMTGCAASGNITKGSTMGYQGSVGTTASHLHVEVYEGRVTSSSSPSSNSNTTLGTLRAPYSYMSACLSW